MKNEFLKPIHEDEKFLVLRNEILNSFKIYRKNMDAFNTTYFEELTEITVNSNDWRSILIYTLLQGKK